MSVIDEFIRLKTKEEKIAFLNYYSQDNKATNTQITL